MTIDTQNSTVTYQGNALNIEFSIPFKLTSLTELRVYVTNRAVTPPSVVQVSSSDYEVTGDFTISAGTLKYPKSATLTPLPATKYITIQRVLPLVQDTNFLAASGYFLGDLERAEDKLVMITQQINEQVGRAVKVPIGSGLNPDDYYADLTAAVEQAETAAEQAQAAVIDMPAVPFKEAFVIGGTSPFSITQSHNGNIAVANVGASGLAVDLPQMSTLTFPYLVALKRKSGSASMTINAYSGDNIEGASSLSMSTNGETIMFIADDDTLAGTWTIVSHGNGSYATGSVNTAMIASNAVTDAKIADEAILERHYGLDSIHADALQDGCVTSLKIDNTAVTYDHLASDITTLLDGILYKETSVLSSNTTLTETHKGQVLMVDTSGGALTLTLPAVTSVTSPYSVAVIRSAGSNTLTVQRASSDTIMGSTSTTIGTTVGNGKIFIADFAGATANTWAVLRCESDANIPDGSIGLTQLSTTVNALLNGLIGTSTEAFSNSGSPYTLDDNNRGNVLNVDASAGAVSLTLPQISGSTNPYVFIVKRVAGTNAITLNRSSTNTFDGASNTSYTLNTTVNSAVLVIADFSGATAGQWTTFAFTPPIASQGITTSMIADGAVGLTQLSTTANSWIANIYNDPTAISTNTTLTASSHKGKLLNITASSTITLTLPLISDQTAPLAFYIKRASGTSTINITPNASNAINTLSDGTALALNTTVGSAITLIADFSGSTAGKWHTIYHNA